MTDCPVCFENMTDAVKTYCGHHFCTDCIEQLHQRECNKCPLCRGKIFAGPDFPPDSNKETAPYVFSVLNIVFVNQIPESVMGEVIERYVSDMF